MERLPRINQLLKKEISQILLREADFPKNVLATVTRVETSEDLLQAKIYISSFPEEKIKDVLIVIDRLAYLVQQKINKRLKMRPVPRIFFREEKQTKAAGKIEEILAKIKKENA